MAIDTKQTEPGIIELVRSAAADTTELVKQQIELTKAEVKENVQKAGSSFGMIAVGASIVLVGLLFLLVTIAYVLVELGLPVWAGFGIVTLFLLIVGAIITVVGIRRAKTVQGPERSMAALDATKSTLRG
ncbi:MAG: phage holin family protein [Candidatus Nanopelagicales bacterium]